MAGQGCEVAAKAIRIWRVFSSQKYGSEMSLGPPAAPKEAAGRHRGKMFRMCFASRSQILRQAALLHRPVPEQLESAVKTELVSQEYFFGLTYETSHVLFFNPK